MIDEVWEILPGFGVGLARSFTGEPVLSHTITPGRGIGSVMLGEPRSAVRQRLHQCMTTVDRSGSTEPPEDLFWDDGLVVRYSPDDRVERIYVVQLWLSNTQTDQQLPVSAVVLSAHDEP